MAFDKSVTGLSVALMLAIAGCSDTLDATVTGTLTYEGKPVPYAMMNFHFQGRGPIAYAVSEEDGSYDVFSASKRGLMVGKYRVAIEPSQNRPLPKKYSAIDTSGLEYEVQKGANKIDISLK